MAHSNSTPNYNLPQFVSTDKPAWLTDVNTAYSDIDTGIHNAQTAADSAQGDATQALSDASDASTTATAADSKASGAIASIAAAFDSASTYNVDDMVMYNNLLYRCTVAVANPGPWSGSANWERVTIISVIPVDAADIAYDGSSSGLTATNANTAIDEVNAKADALGTITTGTFTPSEGISILRYDLYKIGNIKFFSMIFQRTALTSTIGTLSSGFEAVHNVDFAIGSDNSGSRLRINPANNGIVDLPVTIPANTYYAFSVVYI